MHDIGLIRVLSTPAGAWLYHSPALRQISPRVCVRIDSSQMRGQLRFSAVNMHKSLRHTTLTRGASQQSGTFLGFLRARTPMLRSVFPERRSRVGRSTAASACLGLIRPNSANAQCVVHFLVVFVEPQGFFLPVFFVQLLLGSFDRIFWRAFKRFGCRKRCASSSS